METKNIVLFLVLAVLVAGCVQTPSGDVVQEEQPVDITDIIKEALPSEEKPSAVKEEKEAVEEELPEEPEEIPEGVFARITVDEGELVKLDLDVTDPDGDKLTYSFTKPLDNNGEWQTEEGDAGEYPVTITVSDGKLETKRSILIIVKAINKAPELSQPKDLTVTEGDKVVLDLDAEDPNGDKLTWTYSKPFNTRGEWQTDAGDKGKYRITVKVSDGSLEDSAAFYVTVLPSNSPPILEIDTQFTVNEGETVRLRPVVSDPDGDEVELVFTGWMTTDTYKTTFDDAGKHKVVVTATDGKLQESKVVWVTVEDVNRPPEIHGLIVK
ncbi:hypothetical protein KY320_04130 [Candidatus Woesearchaeota archaeon]|nr:hypothetical protein [Candidatus Woesearchaeota archaeon]